jgi:hypothetical protein
MAESRLIQDLSQVPNIVGSLGLAIAEAQKHFDENYLSGLERLAVLAKAFLGTDDKGNPVDTGISRDFLTHLVEIAAPTRYQFTETTLAVKMDLAESKNFSAAGGVAFGFAGVVVNASAAYGSAQEYRAGAEIRTTLHAVLPQDNRLAFTDLLTRAKDLTGALTLPAPTELDTRVIDAMKGAAIRAGAAPAAITVPDATAPVPEKK